MTISRQDATIQIGIRWQTEALTELNIPQPKRGGGGQRTNPTVVIRVRELAPSHTDRQIAALLNQDGLTTGVGKRFTHYSVRWVRRQHGILTDCPEAPWACPTGQRANGRYSTQTAAELLNVCDSTILRWCESSRLDSLQAVPNGPRWIKLTPELIAELRKPTRRSWSDHSTK